MIFPKVTADSLVQIGDGLRIDARKSIYRDITDIKDVLISPEDDATPEPQYVSVFESGDFDHWYLDYLYETAGEKTARVKIVDQSDNEKESSVTIQVVTAETDALFTNDSDIIESEPDILRYLPEGKTSFLYAHREAQRRILAFLDENRIWNSEGERYTKSDIVDVEEFKHWSRFMVLKMIFSQKIVSPDDFFSLKASEYGSLMERAQNRATLRLDENGDGEIDTMLDRVSTLQVRR